MTSYPELGTEKSPLRHLPTPTAGTDIYKGSFFPQTMRVKSGKFGHRVNSDTQVQTVEIQMRRLLMSRFIRILNVCLVNFFLFQ